MGEINDRLKQLKTNLSARVIAAEAYREFYKLTPERSGNAKRNTRLRNDEIQADYPYAQRLDEGYSRQAPRGMTEPTIKHIKKFIKKQEK